MAPAFAVGNAQAAELVLGLAVRIDLPGDAYDGISPLIHALLAGDPVGESDAACMRRIYNAWDCGMAAGCVLGLAVRTDLSPALERCVCDGAPALLGLVSELQSEARSEFDALVGRVCLSLAKILDGMYVWSAAGLRVPHPPGRDVSPDRLRSWAGSQTGDVWPRLWHTVRAGTGRYKETSGTLINLLRVIARNHAIETLRREGRIRSSLVTDVTAADRGERTRWELLAALILILIDDGRSVPDAVESCLRLLEEFEYGRAVGAWPGGAPVKVLQLLAAAGKTYGPDQSAVPEAARREAIAGFRQVLETVVLSDCLPAPLFQTWWNGLRTRDKLIYALRRPYKPGEVSRILHIAPSIVSTKYTRMADQVKDLLLRNAQEDRTHE